MPSTPLPPQDELDAVNEMLESIGQTQVSSLANSGIGDVNTAYAMLLRVTRAVQLVGYDFNTDEAYPLSPDLNGIIKVPEGVLRIDPSDPTSSLKRRRHPDGYFAIWDGDNRSWTHVSPVDFRIIWGFPFDDMPESARSYATMRAARRFQKRIIGSDSLDGYNAEDEQAAWMVLQRDERANRDTNLFRRNAILAQATANRRY